MLEGDVDDGTLLRVLHGCRRCRPPTREARWENARQEPRQRRDLSAALLAAEQPKDSPAPAWRIAAAACRASGVVTWAARLQGPGADEPEWLTGRSESQPHIVQSECVPALIAALEKTPIGAPLGCIAPTSLRYVIECEDEVLAYRAVPQELWRQIWSNNP